MRNLQKRLSKARADLGLEIHLDHVITFPSGQHAIVPVYIPQLGFKNGMIVTASYDDIVAIEKQIGKKLPQVGYGYSTLSNYSETYDREATIEMFSDWGWNGSKESRPAWMHSKGSD